MEERTIYGNEKQFGDLSPTSCLDALKELESVTRSRTPVNKSRSTEFEDPEDFWIAYTQQRTRLISPSPVLNVGVEERDNISVSTRQIIQETKKYLNHEFPSPNESSIKTNISSRVGTRAVSICIDTHLYRRVEKEKALLDRELKRRAKLKAVLPPEKVRLSKSVEIPEHVSKNRVDPGKLWRTSTVQPLRQEGILSGSDYKREQIPEDKSKRVRNGDGDAKISLATVATDMSQNEVATPRSPPKKRREILMEYHSSVSSGMRRVLRGIRKITHLKDNWRHRQGGGISEIKRKNSKDISRAPSTVSLPETIEMNEDKPHSPTKNTTKESSRGGTTVINTNPQALKQKREIAYAWIQDLRAKKSAFKNQHVLEGWKAVPKKKRTRHVKKGHEGNVTESQKVSRRLRRNTKTETTGSSSSSVSPMDTRTPQTRSDDNERSRTIIMKGKSLSSEGSGFGLGQRNKLRDKNIGHKEKQVGTKQKQIGDKEEEEKPLTDREKPIEEKEQQFGESKKSFKLEKQPPQVLSAAAGQKVAAMLMKTILMSRKEYKESQMKEEAIENMDSLGKSIVQILQNTKPGMLEGYSQTHSTTFSTSTTVGVKGTQEKSSPLGSDQLGAEKVGKPTKLSQFPLPQKTESPKTPRDSLLVMNIPPPKQKISTPAPDLTQDSERVFTPPPNPMPAKIGNFPKESPLNISNISPKISCVNGTDDCRIEDKTDMISQKESNSSSAAFLEKKLYRKEKVKEKLEGATHPSSMFQRRNEMMAQKFSGKANVKDLMRHVAQAKRTTRSKTAELGSSEVRLLAFEEDIPEVSTAMKRLRTLKRSPIDFDDDILPADIFEQKMFELFMNTAAGQNALKYPDESLKKDDNEVAVDKCRSYGPSLGNSFRRFLRAWMDMLSPRSTSPFLDEKGHPPICEGYCYVPKPQSSKTTSKEEKCQQNNKSKSGKNYAPGKKQLLSEKELKSCENKSAANDRNVFSTPAEQKTEACQNLAATNRQLEQHLLKPDQQPTGKNVSTDHLQVKKVIAKKNPIKSLNRNNAPCGCPAEPVQPTIIINVATTDESSTENNFKSEQKKQRKRNKEKQKMLPNIKKTDKAALNKSNHNIRNEHIGQETGSHWCEVAQKMIQESREATEMYRQHADLYSEQNSGAGDYWNDLRCFARGTGGGCCLHQTTCSQRRLSENSLLCEKFNRSTYYRDHCPCQHECLLACSCIHEGCISIDRSDFRHLESELENSCCSQDIRDNFSAFGCPHGDCPRHLEAFYQGHHRQRPSDPKELTMSAYETLALARKDGPSRYLEGGTSQWSPISSDWQQPYQDKLIQLLSELQGSQAGFPYYPPLPQGYEYPEYNIEVLTYFLSLLNSHFRLSLPPQFTPIPFGLLDMMPWLEGSGHTAPAGSYSLPLKRSRRRHGKVLKLPKTFIKYAL
ncbi:unnamed protein product [Cyprideis torosa]|uniref:Uncharacterized protein n=1 Tax=Cyprideis torosa TaxID=163714 RepID=A0A7R8ZKU9_9CRUS|nr:unnamed protein product [Cyprideis torosa]CAG0880987.1 unnamed protein product [Cyprideis torosa]